MANNTEKWIEYYDFEKELQKTTSIRLTGQGNNGRIREYTLLSSDVPNLPVNEYVGTGSTSLCVDTSTVYMYEETSAEWHIL